MKELRERLRWWLHGKADWAFDQVMREGYPVPAYKAWLWLAGCLDRLAARVGGPYTGQLHK